LRATRGARKPKGSTFIETHARQFYSLALTQFFLILESSTRNAWNAKNAFFVTTIARNLDLGSYEDHALQQRRPIQSGSFYSCRVVSHLRPQSALSVPQVNCWSVFPRDLFHFKREAPVLFDLDFTSVWSAIVDCCSSLNSLSASVLFVRGCSSTFKRVILKRETRALFVLQSLELQRFSIFGVT